MGLNEERKVKKNMHLNDDEKFIKKLRNDLKNDLLEV